jgi:tripartite-type tricarboxylate transporter receptor subunit TctC
MHRTPIHGAAARAMLLFSLSVTPGLAVSAEASYPNRPVRWVVASAAGGGVDATARILAPKLSDAMGQTWVVDNRAGAGGNVGAEIVARATPDGYTALASTSTVLTVNPSLYRMNFSVERDLQPVTVMALGEQVVVVHPSMPVKSVSELVALAKQKPGALNYASAGTGTAIHLAAELLKLRAGIDMTQVPYKGGGPAAAAVLAGEVQVLVGTVASTIPFIQAGRVRALATTSLTRSKLLADLPTVAESGYPGFDAGLWFGLLLPGGTPKTLTDRVHGEAIKALRLPDVQAAMSRQGLDPQPTTPVELAARIKRETATWAEVIKKSGITLK